MESRRNGPQLSSRHDDDGGCIGWKLSFKLRHFKFGGTLSEVFVYRPWHVLKHIG